jgi:hypothetical protein
MRTVLTFLFVTMPSGWRTWRVRRRELAVSPGWLAEQTRARVF